MNKNTKLRAFPTIPNKNICLPIGTTLAVQYFFEKLNFYDIFGKYKSKGHDINSLLIGLLGYKLTENFSIKEASNWMNQDEVLGILNLKSFNERVLYGITQFKNSTPDIQTEYPESLKAEVSIETYSPRVLFVFSIDFAPSLSSSIMALIASTFSGTTIDSWWIAWKK